MRLSIICHAHKTSKNSHIIIFITIIISCCFSHLEFFAQENNCPFSRHWLLQRIISDFQSINHFSRFIQRTQNSIRNSILINARPLSLNILNIFNSWVSRLFRAINFRFESTKCRFQSMRFIRARSIRVFSSFEYEKCRLKLLFRWNNGKNCGRKSQ